MILRKNIDSTILSRVEHAFHLVEGDVDDAQVLETGKNVYRYGIRKAIEV